MVTIGCLNPDELRGGNNRLGEITMKSDGNNSNLEVIVVDHHNNMDCVYGGLAIVTLLCYRDNVRPHAYPFPHPNYSCYHAGYCM